MLEQAYESERRSSCSARYTVYVVDSLQNSASLAVAEQLLQLFDSHLRRRGRAESTRRQYAYSLRPFGEWLGARGVGDLTVGDLELFLTHWEAEFQLRNGHPPSAATMRGTIGALRVFFSYLEQADLLLGSDGARGRSPVRALHSPPCPQRPNDFLRPYEDRALLTVDVPHHHSAIVWLLRYTGLRVAEAHALTVADVDLTPEREAIAIQVSKTPAGSRIIPVLPQLLPLLHEHLAHVRRRTGGSAGAPLLATKHGTPVTTNYMWRVVKRVAFEAGVRPVACTCGTTRQDRHTSACPRTSSGENRSVVSPHTLRRTFGSDLINRGLRLEAVSRLLGHSSTAITERAYAQLLAPTIRRELFEAFAWELGHEAASGVEMAGRRSSLPDEVTRGRRH